MEIGKNFVDVRTDTPEFRSTRSAVGDDLKIECKIKAIELVGARFSNFLLGKVSLEFKVHGMSIFQDSQMAIFQYYVKLQSCGWACR